MARPKSDSTREATPSRILRSALEEFAQHGFDRARLAEIARRAGIRRPSLLYHFSSKELLYTAVVQHTFARLALDLAPAMGRPGSFPERLEALARSFAEFLLLHPYDARIVVAELQRPDGPGQQVVLEEVAPLLDRVVDFIEATGAAHMRSGLPVRDAVLQIVAHTLLQASAHPPAQRAIWGAVDPDTTWALARLLFLDEEL